MSDTSDTTKPTPAENLSEALVSLDKAKKILRLLQADLPPRPSEFQFIEQQIEYSERLIKNSTGRLE